MINVITRSTLPLPVTLIEWAPRNWSKRDSWDSPASKTPDGFYLTRSGDLYRLSGKTVIFVTEDTPMDL